jgi:sulfur carrier protein ThiS adenylyltransferase
MLPEQFKKNVPGSYEVLQNATVGIAGCGGLGSNAAVALARAGIGALILVDFDRVEASNLNRQYYFQTDIGQKKVEALSRHLLAINPAVHLTLINRKITPADVLEIFTGANLLIEAFDSANAKSWLIESWCTAYPLKPVVCASGLSGIGKTDAITVRHAGMIHVVGDGESDMSMGLCSARVAMVANMQANIAIEILTENSSVQL